MFSLQEYQHVHLLWFKKRSFILVWKPNPPLRSVRGAHLCTRADAASINQALPMKRSSWKRLSSRDQWNLTPATMCRGSAPSALCNFRHQEGSRTAAHGAHTTAHARGMLRQSGKSSRWYCACVELVRLHSSPVKYTLKAVRTRLCARWNGTRKVKYTRPFADALEQLRPCTRTSATTSNFTRTFSKNGCSLEPCYIIFFNEIVIIF